MKKSTIILWAVVLLAAIYFSYEIIFIFPLLGSAEALALNTILIIGEIFAAMFSIYLYHSVLCAMEWQHVSYKGMKKWPFISIQIPTFNEPLSIVKPTIEACMKQNYPKNRYDITVLDDSTDDKIKKELDAYCRKSGIRLIRRDNRKGFKAGALNNALKSTKGGIVALLDADDMPEPTFLAHSVETLMSDDRVAFVQSRNAERNYATNAVTGIGRMIRDLFFGAIMKSKDARKLSIFCGSGGVIRKSLIKKAGGWPEETLTEDIDISTKLFSLGYYPKFINPIECRGLLPSTFTGLTGQTYRWAHGTTKTLKIRWRTITKIPGFFRKIEHFLSCMTYLLGPIIVTIDLAMVTHLLTGVPIFHIYEPATLWIFGIAFTLSSFLALLYVQRADKRLSLRSTIYYIFAVYGLSVSFTKAAISALFTSKAEFFRTPKYEKKLALSTVMKKYWMESAIAVVSIGAALWTITNPLYTMQAIWVLVFGIGFATAPVLAAKYR